MKNYKVQRLSNGQKGWG